MRGLACVNIIDGLRAQTKTDYLANKTLSEQIPSDVSFVDHVVFLEQTILCESLEMNDWHGVWFSFFIK